jgi:hypothetical protein
VPLVCVALGLAAAPALDRFCGRRMVIAIFALLLLERGAVVAFELRNAARRFPPLPPSLAGEVETRLRDVPRTALIWTDVPDWVAWHLDRPALLLPVWRQLEHVQRDHPAGSILLSPDARGRNAADGEDEWVRAIDGGGAIGDGGTTEGGGAAREWIEPAPLPGGSRLYLRKP